MKRALLAILVLIVLSTVARADEATFDGKATSWWAGQLDFDPEAGLKVEKATVRLAKGGKEAIPVLVELMMKGEELGARLNAEQILSGMAIHDREAAPAIIDDLVPLLAEDLASWNASRTLRLLVAIRSQAPIR